MSAIKVAVLRHAPTVWNGERRLQGLTDTPLSDEGERLARTWRLPLPAASWKRLASPLQRARRTAQLLKPQAEVIVDSRLREMSFGVWEGKSVAELRASVGESFVAAERLGLDFQPPGGESPRQVMQRLAGLLAELARAGAPVVAVSHKAVLRALLALATGWDMTGRQPLKLDWQCLHVFVADSDGALKIERLNVPLDTSTP